MLTKFVVIACLLTGFTGLPLDVAPAAEGQLSETRQQRPRRRGQLRRSKRREAKILGLVPLLRIESVRRELQLDDQQKTVVEELAVSGHEDFRGDLRALMQSWRDRPQRNHNEPSRGQLGERIQLALKPEQFERLQQIGRQLDLRRSGAAALSSRDVAAALDLSQTQKQQLRELAQTASHEEEIPTLADTRGATQEILTAEQQDKLNALLGPEFDLPEALLQQQLPATDSPASQSGDTLQPAENISAAAETDLGEP